MADSQPKRGSTEYTSSQAPDTQDSAEQAGGRDRRLFPGGDLSRSRLMVGMESADQDDRTARLAGHPASREDA
jgi:hypothetical protein